MVSDNNNHTVSPLSAIVSIQSIRGEECSGPLISQHKPSYPSSQSEERNAAAFCAISSWALIAPQAPKSSSSIAALSFFSNAANCDRISCACSVLSIASVSAVSLAMSSRTGGAANTALCALQQHRAMILISAMRTQHAMSVYMYNRSGNVDDFFGGYMRTVDMLVCIMPIISMLYWNRPAVIMKPVLPAEC
jgi:hypothetical protein